MTYFRPSMFRKVIALTIIALIVLTAACNASSNNRSKKFKTGKELYGQWCISCHGALGNMMFNGAKDLTISTLSIPERKTLIKNGKGLMAPFDGNLSPQEIARVAEYSATLNPDN